MTVDVIEPPSDAVLVSSTALVDELVAVIEPISLCMDFPSRDVGVDMECASRGLASTDECSDTDVGLIDVDVTYPDSAAELVSLVEDGVELVEVREPESVALVVSSIEVCSDIDGAIDPISPTLEDSTVPVGVPTVPTTPATSSAVDFSEDLSEFDTDVDVLPSSEEDEASDVSVGEDIDEAI